MKNSLATEIKNELPEKKRQLRLLKEEEYKTQVTLLTIQKRRHQLERLIALDEGYLKTVEEQKKR